MRSEKSRRLFTIPSELSSIPSRFRRNSWRPESRSSRFTCWLTLGWVTPSAAAAPKGVPLVGGLTATVRVRSDGEADGLGARFAAAADDIFAFFHLRPVPTWDCTLPDNGTTGPVSRLPIDQAAHPLSPEELVPGLAPSMTGAPSSQP